MWLIHRGTRCWADIKTCAEEYLGTKRVWISSFPSFSSFPWAHPKGFSELTENNPEGFSELIENHPVHVLVFLWKAKERCNNLYGRRPSWKFSWPRLQTYRQQDTECSPKWETDQAVMTYRKITLTPKPEKYKEKKSTMSTDAKILNKAFMNQGQSLLSLPKPSCTPWA